MADERPRGVTRSSQKPATPEQTERDDSGASRALIKTIKSAACATQYGRTEHGWDGSCVG